MLILSQRILRNEEVGIHTPLPVGLPSGIDEPGSGSRRGGRFRPSSDGKEFLDLGTALRLRGHGDVPTLRARLLRAPCASRTNGRRVRSTKCRCSIANGTSHPCATTCRSPSLPYSRTRTVRCRPTAPTISNSVFWSFSHPFPLRRHDTPAPEAIVRVCIYGYLRGGLHPSGGILRGRTFPTGSVPPAEEGLRSRTETCAPATNPFSHP